MTNRLLSFVAAFFVDEILKRPIPRFIAYALLGLFWIALFVDLNGLKWLGIAADKQEFLRILGGLMAALLGAMAAYLVGEARGKREIIDRLEKETPARLPSPQQSIPDELTKKARFGRIILEEIKIKNFKNIQQLDINLTGRANLPELTGNWTCIAGINGAGKSTILQAICLLLLGEKRIPELGGERVRRMIRRGTEGQLDAEITAKCKVGGQSYELCIPLSGSGVDERRLRERDNYWLMDAIWQNLQGQLFVCYGATRNLSDYKDSRNVSLSRQLQRQMTLFDPLTQIAGVDMLLEGGEKSALALQTLTSLLERIFTDADMGKAQLDSLKRIRFTQNGISLEALDLPDGFRSTVAWLADLCAAWHEIDRPLDGTRETDPAKMHGIVLIDEIDLHLHARLQRELVPKLRKALPNVQFIVTTHSPLVLASFDRTELVVLDKDSEGGVRDLDRQLFGLTMDEIYEWLMGTPSESPVIAKMLAEQSAQLGPLLSQSKDTNEKEAEEKVAKRRELLKRLQSGAKLSG